MAHGGGDAASKALALDMSLVLVIALRIDHLRSLMQRVLRTRRSVSPGVAQNGGSEWSGDLASCYSAHGGSSWMGEMSQGRASVMLCNAHQRQ